MPRLEVPSAFLSDGPTGLRKQMGEGDHLGLNASEPATCWPTAAAVANSWDPALGEAVGAALGEEALAQKVNMVLGPGLNIKRSPLCGRNFEYFSEDPYLAGKMAAGYIRGIQSKGVSACPKHFAANSQELRRMANDSVVDERTLREIYLTNFEIAVREGRPGAIMSSYNQINEVYTNEDPHLLRDILRDEWGFMGRVITDAAGTDGYNVGDAAVRAGTDMFLCPTGAAGRYTELTTGTAAGVAALREACKHQLFVYVNSAGIGSTTEYNTAWVAIPVAVSVVLLLVCVVLFFKLVKPAFFPKEEQPDRGVTTIRLVSSFFSCARPVPGPGFPAPGSTA